MEYKRYLNYNLICKNGKEEIEKEGFPKNNEIIYFVNKLGKITDRVNKIYGDVNKEVNDRKFVKDIISVNNQLLDEFLYKIDFFSDNFFNYYNSNFSVVYKCNNSFIKNPFEIYKKEMDNFYKNINQDEEQSDIEQYLKSMQLYNRCAHIMDEFKEHMLSKYVKMIFCSENKDIDIDKEDYRSFKIKSQYDRKAKKYKKGFYELYEICGKKDSIHLKYIKLYEEFLSGEKTFEEVKKSKITQKVVKSIQEIEENESLKFTYDGIYMFFRINYINEEMYKNKNITFMSAIKNYVALNDDKEKRKYKITKCTDKTKNERDKYKNILSFNVKGYNSPYSIHCTDEIISEVESELGKINVELEDKIYEGNQIIQYKYSNKQKEEIINFEKTFRGYGGRWDDSVHKFSKNLNEICENIMEKNNEEKEVDIK